MRKQYDFTGGVRGAVIPSRGKTRITIYVDDDVLEAFRGEASEKGIGYQTLINDSLRERLREAVRPPSSAVRESRPEYATMSDLERRVVREIRRATDELQGGERSARMQGGLRGAGVATPKRRPRR